MTKHVWIAIVLAIGCQNSTPKTEQIEHLKPTEASGSGSGSGAGAGSGSGVAAQKPAAAPAKDIDSKDILARTETADEVSVKHVLISWKDLAGTYHGQQDERGAKRTNDEAAQLAQDVLAKLKADPKQIDALVKQYSEDPGSKDSGEPYTVGKATQFVPEFKNLALRLKVDEAGIVKTMFGYHVIERIPPPPPDPLESGDVLARPAQAGTALVQHIMISWKDAPGAKRLPTPPTRSKADADKLAQDVLAKAKAGGDFAKLMKDNTDDPGSKDKPHTYEVESGDDPLPFAKIAVRLKVGEVGMVKSPFGWHVVKRLAPPPPDPIESADILKRDPVTQKAKVKHILLGYTDAHTDDPRGKTRTHEQLEKLVKDTVAKLNKGDKIEPLMKELSEDPGSAKSGEGYDVTPDAGLVPPFKNLSLRLKIGEVGVVKSQFGVHIIQRVE